MLVEEAPHNKAQLQHFLSLVPITVQGVGDTGSSRGKASTRASGL